MRKYALIAAGILLTYIGTGAYCYKMGGTNRTATYEKDKASCVKMCSPNGGVEYVKTYTSCSCENGAHFDEDDLRR